MLSKAEKTRQYIIEKAAPVFNKQGYADTSLKDITSITGLTKGSVYGNFKDKEELAVEAFNYNIRRIIQPLAAVINAQSTSKHKMLELFAYYRKYYQETLAFGGCPILNIGVDSKHFESPLKERVKQVVEKLIGSIVSIVEEGQASGEFNKEIDALLFARRIYSSIEGCIFTTMIQEEPKHVLEMMDFLEEMTKEKLFL
jgi:AcrR family transcriptional regulator